MPTSRPPSEPSSNPETPDDLTGQTIKGYEVRERIGLGGFGAVYRAYQPIVDREVAIKVILPRYAEQPEFIQRFETEAQLIARLEHFHIVPLYDYWRDTTGAYLVMRYLRESLRDKLASGPWSLELVARLLDQIAGALAVAHHHGVVHRDIKPGNILLDNEANAYLADFGIAQDLLAATPAEEDTISGSPGYLSPEQAGGRAVTPLADQYSLGIVVFELLAGKHPFADSSVITQIRKHLTEPLPFLLDQRTDLPLALDAVLKQATAKNPVERFPDIKAFAAAFRNALDAEAVAPVFRAEKRNTPFMAPHRRASPLVGRENQLRALRRSLKPGSTVAFYGLPGIGKTALAGELANLPEIRKRFRDGVLWVRLGPGANILSLLSTWGVALELPHSQTARLTNLQTWAEAIRSAIGERQMLLVVDDAWETEAALAFKVGGPNCAHLLTTRLRDVALDFAEEAICEPPVHS